MNDMNRRGFVISGVSTAVAASRPAFSQTAASRARVVGANDRVRVGLIGCGGRGSADLKTFLGVPGTECTALCDPDQARSARALKTIVEPLSQRPGIVTGDFRRVLESKDVDAVIVATPDHWHALAATLACQAGKDVYLEKPLSLTIAEGRAVVSAAERYNRIVQVGNQRRSAPDYAAVKEYIASGKLGRIRFVRAWAYLDWVRWIPPVTDSNPPDSVDYDMWLGPAPKRAFNQNRFHFNWRWFWNYGNGLITDWGAHMIDLSLWTMGVAEAPLSAAAIGGKRGDPGDAMETPDTLHTIWEYPGFTMIWEHAIGIGRGPEACEHGVEIHGNDGVLVIGASGWRVYSETRNHGAVHATEAVPVTPIKGADMTDRHHQNFVDCIRSRQKPNSPVEAAHRAMLACHLGSISYRTGRQVRWDAGKETITGDAEAQRYLSPNYRGDWKLA